jgi:hypothetical protein
MTPYQGATEEQLRNPLVRELLGIHNMFRSELATMMQHMDELIAGKQTTCTITLRLRSCSRRSRRTGWMGL